MPVARTHSIALVGVEGHPVEIESDIENGLPGLLLVGLPDTALREARDRIRAAIVNSGEQWPQRRITVGLSPASLPKRGSGFDLGIAVSVLAAAGTVPVAAIEGVTFLGELGLDGRLRPVCGVLPAVAGAAAAGFRKVAVPEASAPEAALVPGLAVLGSPTLGALLAWLRGERETGQEVTVRMSGNGAGVQTGQPASPAAVGPSRTAGPPSPSGQVSSRPDLADVLGQPAARRAAEICAAGGHHLSLLGPPGVGKTMLAERIPTIMPGLDRPAALEVTAIHSVAGTLPPGSPLIAQPPYCAPHHTATKAAIVGGGSGIIRPGAASLAHRGCLFLDEAPEFGRDVLDALRQPLESGEVVVARLGLTARFPARFTLVLAANPCPCAKGPGSAMGCTCSSTERRRYQARLSGPLLDRVDVKVEFLPVSRAELLSDRGFAEPSSVVVKRVEAARGRAAARLRHTPWRLNAGIPGSELRRSFAPGPGALAPLERAMDLGEISARGVDRVIRVAWTLADLAGVTRPTVEETSYALGLWLGVGR
ncbi:MAG TPA: ATP-binding protein [Streptosporangiaceae bacterium]|nr:ATP-binding protein [Streptosporangiaceae bacterium]